MLADQDQDFDRVLCSYFVIITLLFFVRKIGEEKIQKHLILNESDLSLSQQN